MQGSSSYNPNFIYPTTCGQLPAQRLESLYLRNSLESSVLTFTIRITTISSHCASFPVAGKDGWADAIVTEVGVPDGNDTFASFVSEIGHEISSWN